MNGWLFLYVILISIKTWQITVRGCDSQNSFIYLLQHGSQGAAVLLVDPVPLQTGKHLQLLVGPQRHQVDEAVPEWPLRHGVVGKALADSVGWVDGCGAFAFWDHLWGKRRWLTDQDLLS